ncbi:neural cell adhesion molecule 2-like [Haliotis asinina]|uniref:neural cell adhesion molecule 2-like n=1 Tax=Haliotis asinina TaxID=109174 RepID=UPI0035322A53
MFRLITIILLAAEIYKDADGSQPRTFQGKEGRDIILPFQHFLRCNSPVELCHLPLDDNGLAFENASACWSPRCQRLSFCPRQSTFSVSEEYTGRLTYNGDGESLSSYKLSNISKADAGIYQMCYERDDPETAMLIVQEQPTRPYITTPPAPILYTEYTLTCVTMSRSLPVNHGLQMTYSWVKDGLPVNPDQGIKLTGPNLTITNLSMMYDGRVFRCSVMEEEGFWTGESRVSPIFIEYGPMKFQSTVSEDDMKHVTLTCSADCRPKCTLTFTKNNRTLKSTSDVDHITHVVDSRLTVVGDSFTCNASNIHDSVTKVHTFYNNQVIPNIRRLTANERETDRMVIKANQTLDLMCIVIGRPEPTITWYFSREGDSRSRTMLKKSTFEPAYIANADFNVHNYKSSYNVPSVEAQHHGRYCCRAHNALPNSNRETCVTVVVESLPKVVTAPDDVYSEVGKAITVTFSVLSYKALSVDCRRKNNTCNVNITIINNNNTFDTILYQITLDTILERRDDFGTYILRLQNEEGSSEVTLHIVKGGKTDASRGPPSVVPVVSGVVVAIVGLGCVAMVTILCRRGRPKPGHLEVGNLNIYKTIRDVISPKRDKIGTESVLERSGSDEEGLRREGIADQDEDGLESVEKRAAHKKKRQERRMGEYLMDGTGSSEA